MSNVISGNFGKPPPPFDGLTDAEAKTWGDLVACWPADHFKPSDHPLLAEYCRALSMADELGRQVAQTAGMDDLKRVLDLRDREVRRAAALSRTLRLAPQSRADRFATETASRNATRHRPWETDPDDELFRPPGSRPPEAT